MNARRAWIVAAIIAGMATLLSCGNESGPTAPPPNPQGADSIVALANAALENVLFDELNSNPNYPRDVDFTEPYNLYQQALALDTNNRTANFGAAVTGLLVLSTDAEVNAAFDEWKAYLDTRTPFEVPSGGGQPLGIPIGFPRGADALRLPFEIVPLSIVAQARTSILAADPQIGRVQAILRERALPRLSTALGRLAFVAQDANYRFTVTPRMQGDVEATPAEIDQTDILALRAGCSLLSAACRVAISYNLGFAAYDSTNLVNSLRRGSGWLTLVADGGSQMAAARSEILDAVDDVDQAILALEAETDSQDDDVIVIDPGDLSQADVDSIQANLQNVRNGLDQGYERWDDWDGDAFTPDERLRINLGNWFRSPVHDWKELLPGYSISTETRGHGVHGWDCFGQSGSQQVQVTVAASRGYGGNYWLNVAEDGTESSYFYGDEELRIPLYQAAEAVRAEAPNDRCSRMQITVSLYQNLTAGTHLVSASSWLNYCGAPCVVVPVITWDASTFETWTWPDPTLGGLFPDMTSTSQLMSTFGITADQWEQRWVLDWTN